MSANKPLVSFIIPYYNQGRFLFESVSSVYMSYSGPKEVIIVNDGSIELGAKRYLDDIKAAFPSVIIIRHRVNKGLAAARNMGIKASSGEFVQLLDADDLLIPGKVDYQVAHLSLGNSISVSVTDYLLGDETLSTFSVSEPPIGMFELSIDDFLYTWERGLSIPIHCALFRREVLVTNPFEENLRAKEDWVLWCRLAWSGARIVYLNTYGVVYRQHRGAMTKLATRDMGRSWLAASLQIEMLLGDAKPRFLDSAISWYKQYYSNQFSHLDSSPSIEHSHTDNVYDHEETINCYFLRNLVHEGVKTPFKLTVLIPIYDHYRYLQKCVHSALSQLTDNVEIVCIDDNSSDVRVSKILDALSDLRCPQLRVVRNRENRGIASVTNQGVSVSRGEFIAFLDCDDFLAQDAVHEVLECIRRYPNIDYFFSDRIDIDEHDRPIRKAIYGGYPNIRPSGNVKMDLLDGMVASHLKVIRKSRFIEVGDCDPLLSGVQDWDLALKIAEIGEFHYIQKPLYFHRIHSEAVTEVNKVSQFRKTNMVRRRFYERWFERQTSASDLVAYTKWRLSNNSLASNDLRERGGVILSSGQTSVDMLKQLWRSGKVCIFDAREDFRLDWINFLREHNSFFDLIIYEDPKVITAILGYLWDYRIAWSVRYSEPTERVGIFNALTNL